MLYELTYTYGSAKNVPWWPVGWLASKMSYKKVFLQDNAVSHMTYVAIANMLARLIIGATCIRVCPVF